MGIKQTYNSNNERENIDNNGKNNYVSLFQSLGNETLKQIHSIDNNYKNKTETRNIQILAKAVLNRCKSETTTETKCETDIKNIETKTETIDISDETNKEYQNNIKSNIPYILGMEENKKIFGERLEEILEESRYLFYERLGISDNPDLAIQDVLNCMTNFIKQEFNRNNNKETKNDSRYKY
ncbi:MAG: hypothetical protein PHY80_05590 [Rickettsiales bacterium]|nr:hypothetical protein [Rickettsiales bacterium]